METIDYLFKVLLVGNSGVGKSAILQRYAEGTFNEHYLATIGVDFKIKTITVDDKKVKFQIWDTAGQERFRSITTSYYRGAHGIFIVYDVTNRKSFNEVTNWVREANIFHIKPSNILLIGNKIDLIAKREVSHAEGLSLSDEIGCAFTETSSMVQYSDNVNNAFETMAKMLKSQVIRLNKTHDNKPKTKISSSTSATEQKQKCSC